MKYCVTVARYGCLFVEARNETEAMNIANHQTADKVNWSDDWSPTDATPDDSEPNCRYIRERMFES